MFINISFTLDITTTYFPVSILKNSIYFFQEIVKNFRPVFRHFFYEKFTDPVEWFTKRLAYTRSLASSSIGIVLFMRLFTLPTNLENLPRSLMSYSAVPVLFFCQSDFYKYFLHLMHLDLIT